MFLMCTQPNKKSSYNQSQTPRTNNSMHDFFNIFKKDEMIITVKELWYRGLP